KSTTYRVYLGSCCDGRHFSFFVFILFVVLWFGGVVFLVFFLWGVFLFFLVLGVFGGMGVFFLGGWWLWFGFFVVLG
ncbi:hypothetical protein, partial [Salmonella enterica]|uniref:hypothetical protein n=1 Tax=Salmonella enterica TaxID=28901 RepID=UPI0020C277C0